MKMQSKIPRIVRTIFLAGVISITCEFCTKKSPDPFDKDLVDLVNTRIGAISHLLVPTFPTVFLPNSMIRIHPYTTPGVNDNYLASRIFGFPVNIPSHRNGPFSTIMIASDSEQDSYDPASFASEIDRDFEISTPYYYKILLEDPEVWAEYTISEKGAIYRFTSIHKSSLQIAIRCTGEGIYSLDPPGIIEGNDSQRGVTQYMFATIDPVPENVIYISGDSNKIAEESIGGKGNGIILTFDMAANSIITLRTGLSYISSRQARTNMERSIGNKSFDSIKTDAKDGWEKTLSKIKVTGGRKDQQVIFYTNLYRCFERMVNITEDGKYYSIYDDQVHDSGEHDFYVDDWSWDTYRTLHPLRILLTPNIETDIINSYIRIYEQSGWLPAFPTVFGDMGAMIGHHQAAIITDAWKKGLQDFNVNAAYEGLRKNAMEGTRIPWREGPKSALDEIYLKKGFFPALKPGEPETESRVHDFEKRQAVAVTLEHTYDDWCLSELAGEMGAIEDQQYFKNRGQNYRNLYNSEIGFMAPKSADGQWIEPYDPINPAGVGGREYFAESNGWTYTWFVPHDLAGLAGLMGGYDRAVERLDQLFDEPIGRSKWSYLGYMPDATGLTGLFPMGNEPSFHIPYIYNSMGAPWKTQKRVRQLMEAWFRDDLMGVCGDDDGGAMASWYVFSAMGLYPICPGKPIYEIGSPLFEEIRIQLGNGKIFIIKAIEASDRNKYIQSAELNGKPLNTPFITHEALAKGGSLTLHMGERPNKAWGRDKE